MTDKSPKHTTQHEAHAELHKEEREAAMPHNRFAEKQAELREADERKHEEALDRNDELQQQDAPHLFETGDGENHQSNDGN